MKIVLVAILLSLAVPAYAFWHGSVFGSLFLVDGSSNQLIDGSGNKLLAH
jgi:hypothetical protein